MSLHIRLLATALVLVVFAGGAAQALPLPGPPRPAGEPAGFLDTAWGWVVSLFNPSALQSKSGVGVGGSLEGGLLDPESSTLNGLRRCDTEEGGMMDPDGHR
jgi:hypothetical protein